VNAWGAAVAAESAGLPWAQWVPYLSPLPSRDAPPFGPGLAPVGGPLGRVRDRALGAVIVRKFDSILREPLNRIRADAGLASLEHAVDATAAAPVQLYMTAEPFEYRRSD